MAMSKEEKRAYEYNKYHTDEEHRKKKIKRIADRQKERYHTDEEYRKKKIKQTRARQNERYRTDEEFRKKKIKQSKDRHNEKYNSDEEYRNKILENNKKNKQKSYIKNITKAFKLIGVFGCSNKDCKEEGVEYCHQIDWHHQIPEKKTGRLPYMFRNYSWKKIKKEIVDADVIPLCKVCHYREEMHKENNGVNKPIPLYTLKELE